jgi:hypothetical protein
MASCAAPAEPARTAGRGSADERLRAALMKAEAAHRICTGLCEAEGRTIKRICAAELRNVGVTRARRVVWLAAPPGAAGPEAAREPTCLLASAGHFVDRQTARTHGEAVRACQLGGRFLSGELPVSSGNLADICAAVAPRARTHCMRLSSAAPLGSDAAVTAVLREARRAHGPTVAVLLYRDDPHHPSAAVRALVLASDSGWSVCGCSAAGLSLAGQDSAAAAADAAAAALGEFDAAALRACVLVGPAQ